MSGRLAPELHRLRRALQRLDRQVVVVLLAAPLLAYLQLLVGRRSFYLDTLAPALALPATPLAAWAWWTVLQGVLGFVVPVALLRLGFRRRAAEIGLGTGDLRFGLFVLALYVPVVLIGTWVLSADPAFQAINPRLRAAVHDWGLFLRYELLFLVYWIGWEYLWRGFMLFGTAPALGLYAIFVQMLPFAALHFNKPAAEALLSIPGGLLLGALVWRCRSFWIAVPIHFVQMLALDFWCTLRLRTGLNGLDPATLWHLLQQGLRAVSMG